MYSNKGKTVPRVLIADDDPVIRRWLTSILMSDGYIVVSTSDGRDAYRMLQGDADFSGAVFDLAMPFLQGSDLIRYMRTEKRLMRIPVMLITAEQDIAQVANGFTAGATVLLPKPFTKQRLQNALRMMLGHRPQVSETSTAVKAAELTSLKEEAKPEPSASWTLIGARISDDSAPPVQPVNLAVLTSLEGEGDDADSDLIVELIDLYRANGSRQVSEIKAAAAKRDDESVKQSAHALKGSSLTLGANDVADLCQRLETPRRDSDQMVELAGSLETAFASAMAVFGAERARRLVPAFA